MILPNCDDLRNEVRNFVVETAFAKSKDENGRRSLDSIVVKNESKLSSFDDDDGIAFLSFIMSSFDVVAFIGYNLRIKMEEDASRLKMSNEKKY